MKILHVVQLLSPGGIEQFVLTLLNVNFDNTYLLVLEGELEPALDSWPVLCQFKSHIIFANMKSNGKINTIRLIKKVCATYDIRVLHSHYSAPLLYSCFSRLGNKRLVHVHTEHDAWHLNEWKARIIEQIAFALNKEIQLVAVSNQIQGLLKNFFPNKKSVVIRNAIDTNLYKPADIELARKRFNLPSSVIIIGSAGRLNEVKGHEYLIKAMQYLPNNIHLVIAGEGPCYQSLLTLINQLNLSHRVQLLGLVTSMDIYYQACDIFCLPSLNEGLPLTLLEAQSCNLPSVCTDVGSCSEGLDPNSGLMVQPSDPKALASACFDVIKSSGNPREFILKNFSLNTLMEKYQELYRGEK